MWIQSDSDLTSLINFQGVCVTRLMCSPLASNFWSTPVLVHKGLIHGVMTSLPWQTGLQSWQPCAIALAHSVGYKWRSYPDSPLEGLISYMWIHSDSDLTSLINFQGVCVTRLMCSPLAGNFWSTPVLVHKGLIHGVMTSLPWQTGLQSWQSCTIALAHSVGYKLKTINRSTNLAYSLDGYLWAVSALAAEKLQIRCVMETRVITIKPPLQIIDIGNGCEAYSASIYILARLELTTTIQSFTWSQFFLDYNFNYTNVSNFLIWHKSDFAKLTTKEMETLKAKMLKLTTMSMDLFDNVLGNIDENYPFSLSPKLILAVLVLTGICVLTFGIIFICYKRKTSLTSLHSGELNKIGSFLK